MSDVQNEALARAKVEPGTVATVIGIPAIGDPKAQGPAKPADDMKRQTLILYGGAPQTPDPAKASANSPDAPPIVVPGSGTQPGKNAVTRPPPWMDGEVGIGPEIPRSPPVPRMREDSVDEISGSMLIESTDQGMQVRPPPSKSVPPPLRPRAVPTSGGFPPPTIDPIAEPPSPERTADTIPPAPPPRYTGGSEDDERPAGVRDPLAWMDPILDRFPALQRLQAGKPRFFLPVVGGVALLTTVVLFSVLVKACFGGSPDDVAQDKPTKERLAASASAASAAASQATTAEPPAAAAPAAPCTVAGPSKTLAPHALIGGGVEVVPAGTAVAVGFVTGPKDGVSELLDPGTLAVLATAKPHTNDPLRRVTPLGIDGRAVAAADVDRKGDHLIGRRTIVGATPIDVGGAEGALAWAQHGAARPTTLWALPGEGAVEALRGVALDGDKGYAVAFRRGGAIWLGALAGDGKQVTARGDLSGVAGLGPQVGSPAIASSGDTVLVVWADRASATDTWGLRWQRAKGDALPEPATAFEPPPGGAGAPFMSPGVAGLGGGRFLVVWTEGAGASHEVRALTVDAKGAPLGAPLTISGDGVNAGQGQAAIAADGRGVVAYLAAASGKNFELMATPIACPKR